MQGGKKKKSVKILVQFNFIYLLMSGIDVSLYNFDSRTLLFRFLMEVKSLKRSDFISISVVTSLIYLDITFLA